MTDKSNFWLARTLIARVAGWNLHAALVFILCPERFMHGFDPIGVLGMAAVRVTGILFTTLMVLD